MAVWNNDGVKIFDHLFDGRGIGVRASIVLLDFLALVGDVLLLLI